MFGRADLTCAPSNMRLKLSAWGGRSIGKGFVLSAAAPGRSSSAIRWTARRTSAAKPAYPVPRSATVVRYSENLEPIQKLHVNDVVGEAAHSSPPDALI